VAEIARLVDAVAGQLQAGKGMHYTLYYTIPYVSFTAEHTLTGRGAGRGATVYYMCAKTLYIMLYIL